MGDMADWSRDNAEMPWDGMYMSPEEQNVVWDYNKGVSIVDISAEYNMPVDDVLSILKDTEGGD